MAETQEQIRKRNLDRGINRLLVVGIALLGFGTWQISVTVCAITIGSLSLLAACIGGYRR